MMPVDPLQMFAQIIVTRRTSFMDFDFICSFDASWLLKHASRTGGPREVVEVLLVHVVRHTTIPDRLGRNWFL